LRYEVLLAIWLCIRERFRRNNPDRVLESIFPFNRSQTQVDLNRSNQSRSQEAWWYVIATELLLLLLLLVLLLLLRLLLLLLLLLLQSRGLVVRYRD